MALSRRLSRCRSLRHVLSRAYGSSSSEAPQVAVVGSGPAGFYTTQQILKAHPTAHVDVYEKLPVPFGLVRFGVAPDHPEVKNVINTFTQTAGSERCSYVGHVTVGVDVSVTQLREAYSTVVLAYGSDDDKTLGIPGERMTGVLSARSFVGWYNGLPQERELPVNLDVETAVVLGQGNVAIDVARILLTPIDILRKTDITEYTLEALLRSRVERVVLVGRRGPLQVAFTTAELREMLMLQDCKPILHPEDFTPHKDTVKELQRPRRRLAELMLKTALGKPEPETAERWALCKKQWELKFLRSPLEFLSSSPGGDIVSGIRFGVNRLQTDGSNLKAVPTGQSEDLSCGLVLRSIGYKSVPIDASVPFDKAKAIIPNTKGRVTGEKGLYCSGWVKRGPVGVIVTTMTDAFETGKHVADDLKAASPEPAKPGRHAILEILNKKGIQTVSFKDWEKIDVEEQRRGSERGKPREKIVVVDDMLTIAKQAQQPT